MRQWSEGHQPLHGDSISQSEFLYTCIDIVIVQLIILLYDVCFLFRTTNMIKEVIDPSIDIAILMESIVPVFLCFSSEDSNSILHRLTEDGDGREPPTMWLLSGNLLIPRDTSVRGNGRHAFTAKRMRREGVGERSGRSSNIEKKSSG